ncbi:hypothetical protein AB9K36_02405 [Klebsiella michiganensis]
MPAVFCHTGKTHEGQSLIRGNSQRDPGQWQKLLNLIATDAPFYPYQDTGHRPKWFKLDGDNMKFKGYVAALPALLLTGCAMLPGQPTDYDRFCNVSGIAGGETPCQ